MSAGLVFKKIRAVLKRPEFSFVMLPDQDSNLDKLNQNQLYYLYTIGQSFVFISLLP